MSARERLGYYATRLSLAETATTYRFPPTPDLAAQWAERTPDGFVFDVAGWSLLTGCPTLPDSLWPDLHSEIAPSARSARRLYAHHLSADGLDEAWTRFAHALSPLASSGRLGKVVMRYPRWFGPSEASWAELEGLTQRLGSARCCVGLANPRWFAGQGADDTLDRLEAHGISLECDDGPPTDGEPRRPVVAATADTAVVRFRGRRDGGWSWPYRYSDGDLVEWVTHVEALAGSCREVHLIFDNCHGSDAVDNAARMVELLGGHPPGVGITGDVTDPG